MFRNKVCKENDNDPSEYEFKKLHLFCKKSCKFKLNRRAEEVAHCFMLWLKYYRSENTKYGILFDELINEPVDYNEDEKRKLIDESKRILKDKYKITVESEDPLILSSEVPFYKINENP